MNYLVIIPESVYLELQEVSVYYELQQKNLGVKFVQHWETTMLDLKKSPLLYQKKHKQLRTIKVNKFPYLLVFEVIENKIYIYRLTHTKKHPTKTYKR